MRLLFLTSRLPYPPDRGDRVRTHQFLRLFAREHAVTLISFIANEQERLLAEELADYCEGMHLVHLPAWKSMAGVALNIRQDSPFQVLYYRSHEMEKVVEELLSSNSYDAAYVHLFRMAPYLLDHPEIYRILDLTDLISYELRSSLPYQSVPWRAIYRIETPRIERYEQRITACFDEVWFISQRDRDLFAQGEQPARLQIVPSGIDEDLFLLDQPSSKAPKLLFMGHLDVKHNIDAASYMAEDILPVVLREQPECELLIAGAGSGRKILGLERLPGVRVIGYVPDLRFVFTECAISVAPLRFSAGMQFKAVESMAAGLPVVTTSSVSAGLGTEPERDLLVGDSAQLFAGQVVRLLQDEELRQRLGGAGRAFVRARFTLEAAAERLRAIDNQTG